MTRVGPIAAFLVVLAVDALAFAAPRAGLGAALAVAGGLAATAGTLRPLRRVLVALPAVALPAVLFYALLIRGEPAWDVGPLPFSREGLVVGLDVAARLAILVLAALWAVEVVSPRDALDLAARLRFVTLGLVARASTTLAADAKRLREAQAMRGLGARGLATYRAYLVPLFVLSLRRAQTSSRALAMAGLGAGRRTHVRPFPWHRADWGWLSVAGAVALLAFLVGGL